MYVRATMLCAQHLICASSATSIEIRFMWLIMSLRFVGLIRLEEVRSRTEILDIGDCSCWAFFEYIVLGYPLSIRSNPQMSCSIPCYLTCAFISLSNL